MRGAARASQEGKGTPVLPAAESPGRKSQPSFFGLGGAWGGAASSFPRCLPPSLLPILQAAAWELAPKEGAPGAPPCYRLLLLSGPCLERAPSSFKGVVRSESLGWVVRDYILPFINLYRSLGRGFRAFALVESLWGFKFPLRGRRLVALLADWSATSLYTTHSVRHERNFLIHHPQCPARFKVQRSAR